MAVAFAVTTPGRVLFTVRVQVAVWPLLLSTMPAALQVSDVVTDAAGISVVMLGVIDVSESVVPDGIELVVIVNTCWCPTSFTLGAEMLMFASTNRLVASLELPWVPSVARVTSAVAGLAPASPSAKCQTATACAVNTPAFVLLTVTVHVRGPAPLPVTFARAHVLDTV